MKSKPRISGVAGRRLLLCLAGLLLAEVSLSQLTLVLVSNYDIKLNVAGEGHHITNQAKVRNGNTIPIEFQNHRVDVTLQWKEADISMDLAIAVSVSNR